MGHNREPIRHTCPDIDKAIRIIESVIKNVDLRRKEISIESDEDDVLYDISSNLSDVPDILEKLRDCNDKLRDWGIEESENVDRLENDVYDLKIQLTDALASQKL